MIACNDHNLNFDEIFFFVLIFSWGCWKVWLFRRQLIFLSGELWPFICNGPIVDIIPFKLGFLLIYFLLECFDVDAFLSKLEPFRGFRQFELFSFFFEYFMLFVLTIVFLLRSILVRWKSTELFLLNFFLSFGLVGHLEKSTMYWSYIETGTSQKNRVFNIYLLDWRKLLVMGSTCYGVYLRFGVVCSGS